MTTLLKNLGQVCGVIQIIVRMDIDHPSVRFPGRPLWSIYPTMKKMAVLLKFAVVCSLCFGIIALLVWLVKHFSST